MQLKEQIISWFKQKLNSFLKSVKIQQKKKTRKLLSIYETHILSILFFFRRWKTKQAKWKSIAIGGYQDIFRIISLKETQNSNKKKIIFNLFRKKNTLYRTMILCIPQIDFFFLRSITFSRIMDTDRNGLSVESIHLILRFIRE